MTSPLPAADLSELQRAQDFGELHLADVDEAALAAIGVALPHPGRPPLDELAVATAAGRLVSSGLASPQPWAHAAVTPAGPLLTYLTLAVHPKSRVGSIAVYPDAGATVATRLLRVNVLIDVVRGGLALVEDVHAGDDLGGGAPVAIDVLRLDVLVERVVDAAFAAANAVTVVIFNDGRRRLQATRLRVDGLGHAELESVRRGALGERTVREPADRAAFADHLRLRLMAAG